MELKIDSPVQNGSLIDKRALTFLIYLKVTKATVAQELFITFSAPYMILFCLPLMQMDCRCWCLLRALQNAFPIKL